MKIRAVLSLRETPARFNSKLSLFSLTVKILKFTLCLLILTTLKRKHPYTSKSFPSTGTYSHTIPLKFSTFQIFKFNLLATFASISQ